MKLDQVKFKYSGKTLEVMDVIIGHLKRNKKIYKTLIMMLAMGYIHHVFVFLNECINCVFLDVVGKTLTIASDVECVMVMKYLIEFVFNEVKRFGAAILTFILSVDFFRSFKIKNM